ncbi:hypothetical protein BDW60DRAFT_212279 [Aspergillus nidulans var. acristatus]
MRERVPSQNRSGSNASFRPTRIRPQHSKAIINTRAVLVQNKPDTQTEHIKAGQSPQLHKHPCREPKPAGGRIEPDVEPLALESSRRSVNAEQSDYEPAIAQSPSSASNEPIQSQPEQSRGRAGSAKAQDHTSAKPEQRQYRGSQSQLQCIAGAAPTLSHRAKLITV